MNRSVKQTRVGGVPWVAWVAVLGVFLAAWVDAAVAGAVVDGRSYELVSPPDKNGGDVVGAPAIETDGNAAAMWSLTARDNAAGMLAGSLTVARRTSNGWVTADANPSSTHANAVVAIGFPMAVGASFQRAILGTSAPLAPGDTDPYIDDLYGTVVGSGSTDWISHGDGPDPTMAFAFLLGASSDLDRVVFEMTGDDPLVPDAPHSTAFYVRDDAGLRLVSLKPDGSPAVFPVPAGLPTTRGINGHSSGVPAPGGGMRAVSRDAQRVYFYESPGATPNAPLYLRDGDHSYAVSASQRVGDPPDAQDATFLGASPDGGIAYFRSDAPLTADANPGGGMYRYDADSHRMTLVVPAPDAAGLGLVDSQSSFSQAVVSEDASSVYFVTSRALGGEAQEGAWNLYGLRDGEIRFIASLPEPPPPAPAPASLERVSRDGRFALFTSTDGLAGARNGGHAAIYEYDWHNGTLACASCRVDGSESNADASVAPPPATLNWMAPSVSAPSNVTDDGRVFFTTRDPLVPADSGTGSDVYEYDGGTVSLISTGQGDEGAFLVGNTDDGRDVFFLTREQLVTDDEDDILDLYDARIGGGFAPRPPRCRVVVCGPGLVAQSVNRPAVLSPASALVAGTNSSGAPRTARHGLVIVSPAAGAQRAASRSGRLSVTVRVTGGGTLRLTLRGRLGRRTATLTTARKVIRGTSPRLVHVPLRLSALARRALVRHGAVKVTVTANLSSGLRRTSSFTIVRHAR